MLPCDLWLPESCRTKVILSVLRGLSESDWFTGKISIFASKESGNSILYCDDFISKCKDANGLISIISSLSQDKNANVIINT